MTISAARSASGGFAALGVRSRSLHAIGFGVAGGGLLFLSAYGGLALWSKLDGTSQHICTQELYVPRANEISRGLLVLGHVARDGILRRSRDPQVLAAEHALEKAK